MVHSLGSYYEQIITVAVMWMMLGQIRASEMTTLVNTADGGLMTHKWTARNSAVAGLRGSTTINKASIASPYLMLTS
ncbi:MAG: hypothetical protein ACRDE7_07815 [Sphingobacterium sp.]